MERYILFPHTVTRIRYTSPYSGAGGVLAGHGAGLSAATAGLGTGTPGTWGGGG